MPALANVVVVAAGEFQSGAIDTAGAIHTWGLNLDGALGPPDAPHLNAGPARPIASLVASHLAVGKGYMLALTDDG